MNEREFADALDGFLSNDEAQEDLGVTVVGISTFEDSGLLTGNTGLIVRLEDGSEFQVTVVRSK